MANLKWWITAKTQPDNRSIRLEVGPIYGLAGAVEASSVAAERSNPELMCGVLVVNGFAREHVPLPVDEEQPLLEVHIGGRPDDLHADLLQLVIPDAEGLGGLDGLPLAGQSERTRYGLLDRASQP